MRIKVNFSDVQAANSGLRTAISSMEDIQNRLSALQRGVAPEIRARYAIAAQLQSCVNEAKSLAYRAEKLHSTVSSGARKYQETEARLSRGVPNNESIIV